MDGPHPGKAGSEYSYIYIYIYISPATLLETLVQLLVCCKYLISQHGMVFRHVDMVKMTS